jgi:hypothetical protein
MDRFTADDAFADEEITFAKSGAMAVLKEHGVSSEDYELFLEEFGDRDEYIASEVLGWLGY